MGFWDAFEKTVEVAGKLANVYTVGALAQKWMTTSFNDLRELEHAVEVFVGHANAEQLQSMDTVLRSLAKSNAFKESEFQKVMWLFASLHRAWSGRNHSYGH